jgi:hypothetical protein
MTTNNESTIREVLEANRRLLDCITAADWKTYQELCDPHLTAFEPEARGNLIEGMDFHRFYFELGGTPRPNNTTVCAPHVRILGDVAIVCYVRLVQRLDDAGKVITVRGEETRVWQRRDGGWRHVHFHRSAS